PRSSPGAEDGEAFARRPLEPERDHDQERSHAGRVAVRRSTAVGGHLACGDVELEDRRPRRADRRAGRGADRAGARARQAAARAGPRRRPHLAQHPGDLRGRRPHHRPATRPPRRDLQARRGDARRCRRGDHRREAGGVVATASPEPSAIEEAVEQAKRGGFGSALKALVSVTGLRLRTGELGSLPVIVALLLIWWYFQSKESVFLSARNLSNLILQIGVTGTLAVGIVLVLLLGEIDLSVGAVMILSSALIGWAVVNQGWAWYWGIAFAIVVSAAI